MSLRTKFKSNPLFYYGMSIAASWAGVGSMLNSITLTQTVGIVPSLMWSIANSAACILFALLVMVLPEMRTVFKTKLVKYVLGGMSVFQIWLNMNGIKQIFSDTVVTERGGTIIAYAVALFFIVLLLSFGLIRNVLTDNMGWMVVYGTVVLVTILALFQCGGNFIHNPLGLDKLGVGLHKSFLLLSGPFTYTYFFELFEYNDENEDGTQHIDIVKAFTLGGLLFGLYMVFTFILAFTPFNPTLNLIKAICVAFVATSTVSSFIYGAYVAFGRWIGAAVSLVAVLLWPYFMKMGVMGVWTLVASIRTYIVAAMIIAAIAIRIHNRIGKAVEA